MPRIKLAFSEPEIAKKKVVTKIAGHQYVCKFNISGKYTDVKGTGQSRKTSVRDDHVI